MRIHELKIVHSTVADGLWLHSENYVCQSCLTLQPWSTSIFYTLYQFFLQNSRSVCLCSDTVASLRIISEFYSVLTKIGSLCQASKLEGRQLLLPRFSLTRLSVSQNPSSRELQAINTPMATARRNDGRLNQLSQLPTDKHEIDCSFANAAEPSLAIEGMRIFYTPADDVVLDDPSVQVFRDVRWPRYHEVNHKKHVKTCRCGKKQWKNNNNRYLTDIGELYPSIDLLNNVLQNVPWQLELMKRNRCANTRGFVRHTEVFKVYSDVNWKIDRAMQFQRFFHFQLNKFEWVFGISSCWPRT
jgi:hypothetical protein